MQPRLGSAAACCRLALVAGAVACPAATPRSLQQRIGNTHGGRARGDRKRGLHTHSLACRILSRLREESTCSQYASTCKHRYERTQSLDSHDTTTITHVARLKDGRHPPLGASHQPLRAHNEAAPCIAADAAPSHVWHLPDPQPPQFRLGPYLAPSARGMGECSLLFAVHYS